jgi:hypothetical protein
MTLRSLKSLGAAKAGARICYTERSARFAQRRRAGGSGGRAYASMHAELGGVSFHLGGLFRDRWVICGIRGIVLGGGVPHRETHARIGNPRSLGCPSPAQAARLVVTEGLPLTAFGLGVGFGICGIAGSARAHLLFGVTPTDAATWLAVAALLTALSPGACRLRVRRIARIDPMLALRRDWLTSLFPPARPALLRCASWG